MAAQIKSNGGCFSCGPESPYNKHNIFSSSSLQERQQNLYKRHIHNNSQFRQQELL